MGESARSRWSPTSPRSSTTSRACTPRQAKHDRAMDLLERAVLPGMANRVWLEHDSDLDSLRELPRFRAFVATLK